MPRQQVTLRYHGSPALATRLVAQLEHEGFEVRTTPIVEQRSATETAVDVTLWVLDKAGGAAVGALLRPKIEDLVRQFKTRFPRDRVDLDD